MAGRAPTRALVRGRRAETRHYEHGYAPPPSSVFAEIERSFATIEELKQ